LLVLSADKSPPETGANSSAPPLFLSQENSPLKARFPHDTLLELCVASINDMLPYSPQWQQQHSHTVVLMV
jgi:hypothetical protein